MRVYYLHKRLEVEVCGIRGMRDGWVWVIKIRLRVLRRRQTPTSFDDVFRRRRGRLLRDFGTRFRIAGRFMGSVRLMERVDRRVRACIEAFVRH